MERKSLKGPRRIILQGPEEHKGEDDISWLNPKEGMRTLPWMSLRINKMKGLRKDADAQSPILDLGFRRDGTLWISLAPPGLRPAGVVASVLNPYLNKVSENPPSFVVVPRHLRQKTTYLAEFAHSPRGDFLCIEERKKPQEDGPQRLLLINLWAVFSFEGLQQIRSDSKAFFANKEIGDVPAKKGSYLPFFRHVEVRGGRGRAGDRWQKRQKALWDFEHDSRKSMQPFLECRDPSSRTVAAEKFDFISWTVFSDRATKQVSTAVQEAADAFLELFPDSL